MSWSSRRQFGILAAFGAIVAVPVTLAAAYLLWERPTCDDGIWNGGETGVDCGGACALVCVDEANPIVLSWVRAFMVAPGRYNVVALVENPNSAARADNLRYRVRVLDEDGVAVAEREGRADLDPQSLLPIVELGLDTGERAAARAEFAWLDEPTWAQAEPEARVIAVVDERIDAEGAEPRVRASIQNLGVLPIGDVSVVAIVYDIDGNAIAASRTLVDRLAAGERREVVFTWPAAWSAAAEGIDVMPVYDAPSAR
jgi:hypothetical protein